MLTLWIRSGVPTESVAESSVPSKTSKPLMLADSVASAAREAGLSCSTMNRSSATNCRLPHQWVKTVLCEVLVPSTFPGPTRDCTVIFEWKNEETYDD